MKQAKSGGISSWASSFSVYNKMLEQHPELVELMAQPWYFDRKNEVPEGKLPYFAMPIFNRHQVSISTLCPSRPAIRCA